LHTISYFEGPRETLRNGTRATPLFFYLQALFLSIEHRVEENKQASFQKSSPFIQPSQGIKVFIPKRYLLCRGLFPTINWYEALLFA